MKYVQILVNIYKILINIYEIWLKFYEAPYLCFAILANICFKICVVGTLPKMLKLCLENSTIHVEVMAIKEVLKYATYFYAFGLITSGIDK